MKIYTRKKKLLSSGITRFATEFISMASLLRYSTKLKKMCTLDEWVEFNNTTKRKVDVIKVVKLILSKKFQKYVCNNGAFGQSFKTINQDNKPTLPIIYEAMDRAKMTIQKSVKS